MKKLAIVLLTIVLTGCQDEIYYNRGVVGKITKLGNDCEVKVYSRVGNKTSYTSTGIIKGCPCDKYNVGDTIKFY